MAEDTNTIKNYSYSGIDRRGVKVSGVLPGRSAALVKAQLRKQGINADRVSKKSEPINIPFLSGKKKIAPMEVAIFVRQLATMMKAGVPLVQSFEIVADGLDNPSMREVVLGIKAEVEGGENFAGALKKYPLLFDDLFVSLVASGEQSGALETMLDRIATYKEKSELLKAKIKKALRYPTAVIIVAVIVSVILLVKVVPTFEKLFNGFGARLPAFTEMVIHLSDYLQKDGVFVGIVVAAVIAGLIELKKRSTTFVALLDRLVLKLPIVGKLTFMAVVARYCRTLATTFAAGVPLIEALESCAGASGNTLYRDAILRVRDDVATGQQLAFSMRLTNLFPAMALQMVSIGEESGKLDDMLDKVASYYEAEVDNMVDGLTALMEPLIMAVLGVLVGGLIIAMYLPIFQMGSVV